MAHTQDAIVYGPGGILWMIVIPTDDSELDDPAFNPPGATQLRVPLLGTAQAGDATTKAIAAAAAKGVTVQLMPAIATTGATGATGPVA